MWFLYVKLKRNLPTRSQNLKYYIIVGIHLQYFAFHFWMHLSTIALQKHGVKKVSLKEIIAAPPKKKIIRDSDISNLPFICTINFSNCICDKVFEILLFLARQLLHNLFVFNSILQYKNPFLQKKQK